jgi:DNA/RNA endonuclease G (NUC1)
MANMSAQRGRLNRTPWAQLEAQVLFWGAKHGPIYVTTGPIFNKFPARKFEVYKTDVYDEDELYTKNLSLTTFNPGDNRVADIRVPTGYYKVIFKEATATEEAQAIAFLLPHTNENLSSFWGFVARIDVVEEASGVRFHAIPDNMKNVWGSDYFFDRNKGNWGLRQNCNNNYTAANWIDDSTHAERMERCDLM